MRYSPEALARIEELQAVLDARDERLKKEAAENKAKWAKYQELIAQMPEYEPGARKFRHPVLDYRNL